MEASGKTAEALEQLTKEKDCLTQEKNKAQSLLEELRNSNQEIETQVRDGYLKGNYSCEPLVVECDIKMCLHMHVKELVISLTVK